MKLYYHSSSSASLRVLIFLSCRGVPENKVGFYVRVIEVKGNFDTDDEFFWTCSFHCQYFEWFF